METVKLSRAERLDKIFGTSVFAVLLAIFCNVLWGSAFPFIKLGYRLFAIDSSSTASIFCFAGVRFMLGSFLVLLGIGPDDTEEIVEKMADKMMRLRIFSDENDKINRSLSDVDGELLLVSQFTLYAAPPAQAEALYEYCKAYCHRTIPVVESGIFGADMQVELLNDGPFTVVLDSDEIVK